MPKIIFLCEPCMEKARGGKPVSVKAIRWFGICGKCQDKAIIFRASEAWTFRKEPSRG